ncbi:MAG TPA: GH25 family lysozyme, partial [Planctomycetota bacterium]|nr:GH25 family lysozyme [Planctomycetota bacterium]
MNARLGTGLLALVALAGCNGMGGSSSGSASTAMLSSSTPSSTTQGTPSAPSGSTTPGSTVAPFGPLPTTGTTTPPRGTTTTTTPSRPATPPSTTTTPPPSTTTTTPSIPPTTTGGPPSVSSGAKAKGIDVSYYQGTIDWAQVAGAGINFAIARVSDGSFLDPQFPANWAGMKANGIVRGAYHFFRASEDGVQQATHFCAQFTLEPGDLPPVADVETLDGQSASTLQTQLVAFLNEVQAKTGVTPMIYTSKGIWNPWGLPAFNNYPLWVANWQVSSPSLPNGWSDWTIWQTTDSYSVPGMSSNPDGDEFNGTLADLQSYVHAAPGSTPPPSTTTTTPPTTTTSGVPTAAQVNALPTLQQGSSGQNVVTLQQA